jgi:hypothetical protein
MFSGYVSEEFIGHHIIRKGGVNITTFRARTSLSFYYSRVCILLSLLTHHVVPDGVRNLKRYD